MRKSLFSVTIEVAYVATLLILLLLFFLKAFPIDCFTLLTHVSFLFRDYSSSGA